MLHLLFDPFIDYGFMRRALVACCALSITPLGCFLLLRRMSLIGDALSHAILPGVAIGYLISGMSLVTMGICGIIAGILIAILAGWVSSVTQLKEDASFAGFYLGSLALGVILVSLHKSDVDLLHVLFGSIFTITKNAINFIGLITSITFIILAIIYRALVIETFDTTFLKINATNHSRFIQTIFLMLVVLNLIAGFQVLGTLLSIGLMILPSVIARCWTSILPNMIGLATIISLLCSWCGLLLSFYTSLPAGPTIVLSASLIFLLSLLTEIINNIIIRFNLTNKKKKI